MAGTFAIFEFDETIAGGDVIEPPYFSQKQWPIGVDYTCANKCVAVQVLPSSPIRITTDGSQATPQDRFINTDELATIIFKKQNAWIIRTVAS